MMMMTSLSNPNQQLQKITNPNLNQKVTNQKQDCSMEQEHQRRVPQRQHCFEEIEEQTREQHQSDRWHQERKYKLTSSRFGEICKRHKFDLKYCESLSTKQKDLSHIPAVKFGLNQGMVA